MNKPHVKWLAFLLLTLGVLSVGLCSATGFAIKSNPDPPPTGVVGSYYEVTFTTNSGYVMDSWVSSPANPVPGLSFSKMQNVASIKLSGTPSKAGEYTFTLTVYYKGAQVATRTFTIKIVSPPSTPKLDVNMLQLQPSVVILNKLYPQQIYLGQKVLFVFWTTHPDALHVVWSGVDALPGTTFRVVEVGRFLQKLPPEFLSTSDLRPLTMLDPNAPILVMEGEVSSAGVFRVSVQARLGSALKTKVFTISVLEPTLVLDLRLQPSTLAIDRTGYFLPVNTTLPANLSQRRFTLTLNVEFRGYVGNTTVNLKVSGPQALTIWAYEIRERLNGMNLSFTSNTVNPNTKSVSIACEVLDDLGLPSAPGWPGDQYLLTITAEAEFMGHPVLTSKTLTVNYFYYLPDLRITLFQPLSQLSNPNHVLWWDTHRLESNVLVYGKQTTFRFRYTLNSSFPVAVTLKLTLPKTDWEWNLTQVNEPGPRFVPNCARVVLQGWEDYWDAWFNCVEYEETSDDYVVYEKFILSPTSREAERVLLAEKFLGRTGWWFPKPKTTPARATLEVYSMGRASGEELPVGARIRVQGSFNSPVITLGNLKLGFFIMDPGWFRSNQYSGLRSNFPGSVTKYLEGSFPLKVKEVVFMGNVSRPHVFGLSTEWSWIWDADTWGEEVSEAGLDRGVVVVPDGALSWLGGGVVGVTLNVGGRVCTDASKIAIVEYSYAKDQTFLPVVAHELSHTFGYDDIYFGSNFPTDLCWTCEYFGYDVTSPGGDSSKGCTGDPRVPGYFAYFDEQRGGIIWYDSFVHDIMACVSRNMWAYHSWFQVYQGTMNRDPPAGLLVSLLIFRNGTVIGRPFSILFNHSQPLPPTSGVGNVSLQLLSRSGSVLRSYPFNLTFRIISDPQLELNLTALVVTVEWFDDLSEVRLVDGQGRVLYSRMVTPNAPEVKIKWPAPGLRLGLGRKYTFSWQGSDADVDKLYYNVQIRRLGRVGWTILAHRIEENQLTFEIPRDWEPGVYELLVKATDGVNTGYQLIRVEVVEKLPEYRVEVTSNIGIEIPGSGVYEEGDLITLEAPSSVSMPGILGFLGGRFVFQEWSGAVKAQSNHLSFAVTGGGEAIRIEAVYREDYMQVLLILAALALASVALYVVMRTRRGRTGK